MNETWSRAIRSIVIFLVLHSFEIRLVKYWNKVYAIPRESVVTALFNFVFSACMSKAS